MASEPSNLPSRFCLDARGEWRVLGIGGASECEVLPYKKSKAIALLIEGIALVPASPPDAQHVEVGIARLMQSLGDSLTVTALIE
jgi:hypothetical protein